MKTHSICERQTRYEHTQKKHTEIERWLKMLALLIKNHCNNNVTALKLKGDFHFHTPIAFIIHTFSYRHEASTKCQSKKRSNYFYLTCSCSKKVRKSILYLLTSNPLDQHRFLPSSPIIELVLTIGVKWESDFKVAKFSRLTSTRVAVMFVSRTFFTKLT